MVFYGFYCFARINAGYAFCYQLISDNVEGGFIALKYM